MPASITTFDLGWSTPDGQSVFSNINLGFGQERVGIVGRNGIGKTSLLRLLAGERDPTAGRIIVNGTVATLRQTLQVDPTETIADLFGVRSSLAVLRRADAGNASADDLATADWTLESRMASALARVGLGIGADEPLASLSGGQRTRAAMAAAILADPDFLLLDEPSNNLDRDGRAALLDLLQSWPSGAIIVSHDRALLDAMDAIVEMTSLGATRYGGNWTHYRERKAIELASAHHDLDVAEQALADIRRKSQIAVERQQRRDGAGGRKAARGDMPRILAGARKQRAENTGGGNARLADRQRSEALATAFKAREQIEMLEGVTISLPTTGLPASKTVLSLRNVTAGHVRASPLFTDMSLEIAGPERIALVGPNGSGKTTLLRLMSGRIAPWSGTIARTSRFAMLDQQVDDLDPALSLIDNVRALNPDVDDFACRSALARFLFRGTDAQQRAGALSGGQMLRAALACILANPLPPELLILDEPTNHLDLDTIAAMESDLLGYDGALLVVSHDERFLDNLSISRTIELKRLAQAEQHC